MRVTIAAACSSAALACLLAVLLPPERISLSILGQFGCDRTASGYDYPNQPFLSNDFKAFSSVL